MGNRWFPVEKHCSPNLDSREPKMRVLMVSWEYPPHIVGGLGAHVADLVPTLAAEGVSVHVVTPMLRGGEVEETMGPNVHVRRVPIPHRDHQSFTAFVAHANYELERVIRSLYPGGDEFTLIHTHDWLTATAAIALKQHWYVPLLATIHATERGRGRGYLHTEQAIQIDKLEWQLTYEAWRIIVCSRFMARQLVETLRTPPDKIDIVPNGTHIRPGPFADEQARRAFRQKYAQDDEYIIFSVGRIVYEKGLHVLIDALPDILKVVRARVVIAGTGPYLDTLRGQAAGLGLQDRITFTGFISDQERDRLYYVADVTTFPSLYEPFGIVVLEAYAAGCPVVVSQTGGLMEVVRKNETGITVAPGNPFALAQGILETIQNREQTNIRVEKARREVQEVYNWTHIARATIRVYERIYREWQEGSWGKERRSNSGNYSEGRSHP